MAISIYIHTCKYIYVHINKCVCIPSKTNQTSKEIQYKTCDVPLRLMHIYIYMKQDMAICVSNIRGHIYSKCWKRNIYIHRILSRRHTYAYMGIYIITQNWFCNDFHIYISIFFCDVPCMLIYYHRFLLISIHFHMFLYLFMHF